ncbi:plasmid mobilization protein [Maridesulfovibrio zosterae]|uniref:plasmid mobilization protein n=1 Tax=Maridesulfovibrio zosterae TaxID=82171 RepID=UPI000685BDD7
MKNNNQKKTGRPTLPSEDVRQYVIGVRVNLKERTLLASKARMLNLSLSQCLRELSIQKNINRLVVPAVNRQAYAELSKLGSNLNQLLQLSYRLDRNAIPEQLINETLEAVTKLRCDLLGLNKAAKNDS